METIVLLPDAPRERERERERGKPNNIDTDPLSFSDLEKAVIPRSIEGFLRSLHHLFGGFDVTWEDLHLSPQRESDLDCTVAVTAGGHDCVSRVCEPACC